MLLLISLLQVTYYVCHDLVPNVEYVTETYITLMPSVYNVFSFFFVQYNNILVYTFADVSIHSFSL